MKKSLPSRYLILFCVVSVLLGCVPPVFASELQLSSLKTHTGLTFQSVPLDQSAITLYDFSYSSSQGVVISQESTPDSSEPLSFSQEILEASFILSPIDPLPSLEPTTTLSLTPSPTMTPLPSSTTATKLPSTLTPSPTITPTSTPPEPTPTVTSEPTPSPTLPPIPASTDIDGYFVKYSDEYHVDRNVLTRIARCESGFNAHARYLDYGGMFQFATSSWMSTRQSMGMDTNPDLRFSAEEAIRTAAFKIGRDGTGAWPNC